MWKITSVMLLESLWAAMPTVGSLQGLMEAQEGNQRGEGETEGRYGWLDRTGKDRDIYVHGCWQPWSPLL